VVKAKLSLGSLKISSHISGGWGPFKKKALLFVNPYNKPFLAAGVQHGVEENFCGLTLFGGKHHSGLGF